VIIGLNSRWITSNQTCAGRMSSLSEPKPSCHAIPRPGVSLKDLPVWFVCGHTVDAALYYTFDADHVYFLSIKRTKMPEL
jgi:hypothetical protein